MHDLLRSLKLISDPNRLRVLLLLQHEGLTVAELQEILGVGQSRMSALLSQLREASLVTDQRSGKNNVYSCSAPKEVLDIAQLAARDVAETMEDEQNLRHILRRRKDKVRAYFDELAGKFGRQYVPGRSWRSLAEAMIAVVNYDTVADLGAGEGTLSQLLARRAKKVIAVDNSEAMVELGRCLAKENELPNLEYRLGDLEQPPIDDGSVDLVVFSQALHHATHPDRALCEARRIIRPGGTLLVLDLLQHSFEKARELYADVWLGFSEAKLAGWIEAAGFQSVETAIADREDQSPHFQTLLATATAPKG